MWTFIKPSSSTISASNLHHKNLGIWLYQFYSRNHRSVKLKVGIWWYITKTYTIITIVQFPITCNFQSTNLEYIVTFGKSIHWLHFLKNRISFVTTWTITFLTAWLEILVTTTIKWYHAHNINYEPVLPQSKYHNDFSKPAKQ